MAKRAIYLDARERELARRIIRYTVGRLESVLSGSSATEQLALNWTRDEAVDLLSKFEESAEEQP